MFRTVVAVCRLWLFVLPVSIKRRRVGRVRVPRGVVTGVARSRVPLLHMSGVTGLVAGVSLAVT